MKLAPYEMKAPLGDRGGVYRALDAKLGREVALKVLPDALAHGAQSVARLQREALVLASLDHPNLAAIFGLDELGGVRALPWIGAACMALAARDVPGNFLACNSE